MCMVLVVEMLLRLVVVGGSTIIVPGTLSLNFAVIVVVVVVVVVVCVCVCVCVCACVCVCYIILTCH